MQLSTEKSSSNYFIQLYAIRILHVFYLGQEYNIYLYIYIWLGLHKGCERKLGLCVTYMITHYVMTGVLNRMYKILFCWHFASLIIHETHASSLHVIIYSLHSPILQSINNKD